MDNLDVICIGAAIVDIPLQPVSKNIFDVDSYPLERIAMTTGGDAINDNQNKQRRIDGNRRIFYRSRDGYQQRRSAVGRGGYARHGCARVEGTNPLGIEKFGINDSGQKNTDKSCSRRC